MKALALETATLAASLALVDGDRVLIESNRPPGETHSKTLLPEIQRMLVASRLSIHDLDYIAVSLGPGSFTGLRIGLSAAKGLAWAAGKPLVGVPTLDAMILGLPMETLPACPVLDARKGQIYAAQYRPGPDGRWTRFMDVGAFDPETLGEHVHAATCFFGEGLGKWEAELTRILGAKFKRGPQASDYPRAVLVARAAADLLAQGVDADPANVAPVYIRPPDIRPSASPQNVLGRAD